jgi:hypothetical protein
MVETWNDPSTGHAGVANEVWQQRTQISTDISGPANLQDNFERIPEELRVLRQWVVWRYERPDASGKPTKPPYDPRTNKHASSTDARTWGTYDECVAAYRDSLTKPEGQRWNGLGFVFSEHDPYAGIDFDAAEDEHGQPLPNAAQIIAFQAYWQQRLNSYSELSPSGKGLHVIVKGGVPQGRNFREHKIEIYSSGRFFTMTGDVHNDAWIADCHDELNTLWTELSKRRATHSDGHSIALPNAPQTEDDWAIFDRASQAANGTQFVDLWEGRWRQHYKSQSEADAKLFDDLMFYSPNHAPNTEQVKRMFLESELGKRPKARRADYIVKTMTGAWKAMCDRHAIPADIAAFGQRFATEAAQSQDRPWPSAPSQPQGTQPVTALQAFASLAPPEPLSHELPPAPPFPMDALGPILSAAARAIIDLVQCPDAIAAQSVLGAASLAVQGHANVVIPATGRDRPLSLFLLTVAPTGERKSAADSEALAAVNAHEAERFKQHDAELPAYNARKAAWEIKREQIKRTKQATTAEIESAINDLGASPEPPLKPLLTCNEPTYEGLYKLFEAGMPSLGLFSDEGAHFVSGHGMKAENRLAMAAGLCSLWDGASLKRVRATGEATMLRGRRLAMHLMMQPDVSAKLLSDPELKDQGLLSRILASAPAPKASTRFQRDAKWETSSALAAFNTHLARILATPLPMAEGERNELAPRKLPLSPEAIRLWRDYADDVERKLGQNGEYEPITGLANKLPEHALRLAAVIALVELGPSIQNIPAHAFTCGMQLANFYASEALRLWDSAATSPEIKLAKTLLKWLHERGGDTIMLRDIYRQGFGGMRDAASSMKIARVLQDHGWLIPAGNKTWTVRR